MLNPHCPIPKNSAQELTKDCNSTPDLSYSNLKQVMLLLNFKRSVWKHINNAGQGVRTLGLIMLILHGALSADQRYNDRTMIMPGTQSEMLIW